MIGRSGTVQVQVFTNKCVTDVVFVTYESGLPNVQYPLIYYGGLNCSENLMIIQNINPLTLFNRFKVRFTHIDFCSVSLNVGGGCF